LGDGGRAAAAGELSIALDPQPARGQTLSADACQKVSFVVRQLGVWASARDALR
jgi:hypothetical protein